MDATPGAAELVRLLEQALSSVEEICSQLEGAEWDLPTDCDGWSVKDNLSHIVSYEALALGRPAAPAIDLSGHTHLRNAQDPFAANNEYEVEARRGRAPAAVLEEFREVSVERLKYLAGLDEAGWEADTSVFPFGEVPTLAALPTRILDVFYHEQDIRRATGKPGHLDGDVARLVFERFATRGLPKIVAKDAAAPDGTVAVFEVGLPGRTIAVRVEDGRGEIVSDPGEASVRFAMDAETFFCLIGGRWTIDSARERGLTVQGDQEVAATILARMAVIP